jgi:hypothetical protein
MLVLLLLSVLLFAALPCPAQMMEAAEYRGFLKRLDGSVAEWRERVAALNVDQINVTFTTGRKIEEEKDLCLRHLAAIHDLLAAQLAKDRLSDDMRMGDSLDAVSSMLTDIVGNLPENSQAVHWAVAVPSLGREIASYQEPLRKHALAYAELLQEKAVRCSK